MKAKDFRVRAWNSLNGKWGTLVVITLIISLIQGVLSGLSVIGVGAIALLLVIGPITLSIAIISLKVVRGYKVDVGDTFIGFKNFANAFLLSLVNEIFIALWSLLFIIPGIVKAYAYSMSHYILADNPNMDISQARKRSIELMDGNKWRLFCLDLSFIGWGILCILTCGILSFWVQPYRQCAYAAFYEEILREKNGENANTFAQSDPQQPAEEVVVEEAVVEETVVEDTPQQPAEDVVVEAAPVEDAEDDSKVSKFGGDDNV
ncbi:MAG: DUF975 family protein [Candidatus Coproplasma sp.]